MKITALTLMLSALLASAAPAADLFAGTWKEDLAKSTNSWNEKPSVPRTRTYVPAANGAYDVRIESTDQNGKPVTTTLHAAGNTEMPYTNTTSKGVGLIAPTHVISRRVDDRTLVATYRRNGKDVGTSTSKVSADGKTLTMVLNATSVDGKKVAATSVYHK
jgi:hypothetical protein